MWPELIFTNHVAGQSFSGRVVLHSERKTNFLTNYTYSRPLLTKTASSIKLPDKQKRSTERSKRTD